MAKKVLSYEEKKYEQGKNLYDTIAQCLDEVKYGEVNSANKWNAPAEHVKGVTIRFIGESFVELSYTRYEVTTIEGLTKLELEEDGKTFLKEVVKQLKKKFKSKTGKTLKVTETSHDHNVDKVSRMLADTSWVLGYQKRPYGRYLVKDAVLYEIGASL